MARPPLATEGLFSGPSTGANLVARVGRRPPPRSWSARRHHPGRLRAEVPRRNAVPAGGRLTAPATLSDTVLLMADSPHAPVAMTEPAPAGAGFPQLDDDQLAIVISLGERRSVHVGEVLFSPADAVRLDRPPHRVGRDPRPWRRAHRAPRPSRLPRRGQPRDPTTAVPHGQGRRRRRGRRGPCGGLPHQVLSDVRLSDTVLEAFIARRAALQDVAADTLQIIGSVFTPASMALREYAGRSRLPHRWIDAEADPDIAVLLDRLGVGADDLPVVVTGARVLRRATPGDVAVELGLTLETIPERCYDVVVVGAGPAGLAASVYAASEGLRTLTLDSASVGGQAASSSRIENYLGFPTGISGQDLTARAALQAQKFGAVITSPCAVTRLDLVAGHHASPSPTAPRWPGAPSSPPPSPTTASSPSPISSGTRWRASTTRPRSSKPGLAPGSRYSSSEVATPPDRRPCSSPSTPPRCASPSADRWPRP